VLVVTRDESEVGTRQSKSNGNFACVSIFSHGFMLSKYARKSNGIKELNFYLSIGVAGLTIEEKAAKVIRVADHGPFGDGCAGGGCAAGSLRSPWSRNGRPSGSPGIIPV
jgi:hypothetical protein